MYKYIGKCIEIELPDASPVKGKSFAVRALYKKMHGVEKYRVSMTVVLLEGLAVLAEMQVCHTDEDTGRMIYIQPVSGDSTTIETNIERIVTYMLENGLLDEYINTLTQFAKDEFTKEEEE